MRFGHRIFLQLLALYTVSIATAKDPSLEACSLEMLELRLVEIDSNLSTLASSSLRGGVGNLGWISKMHQDGTKTEWAQIDLGETNRIDQIVLTPVIRRDNKGGYQADGFPRKLKLIVGTNAQDPGQVVAEFDQKDQLLPRVAPLVIPIESITASWIRIEAETEPSSVWDGKFAVQLSEILAFHGDKNLALNRPVQVSSAQRNWVKKAMYQEALTDGLLPYVMDAAEGTKSDPYIAFYNKKDRNYSLTVDLENTLPLDGIILHAADIRENTPRIHYADYGMPKHLQIEGATRADFSDSILLAETIRETIYETGPIVMLRFPKTACRYIRLTAIEGYKAPEAKDIARCFGLAEIELLSQGRNVALNKTTLQGGQIFNHQGKLTNLTDGRNHFGSILPIRLWLNELALRHDLEVERPLIAAELNSRYARQKLNLRIMYWTVGILVGVAVLAFIIERTLHRRHMARARQRFTANLHDELGANLHTIGLLGDTAQAVKDDPDKLDGLLQRIRALTERSGTAARHCANLIEAEGLFENVAEEMHQISSRVMNDLNHTITIDGEAMLRQLAPRTCIDLLLFYKESLINIIRHSGATQVSTKLTADKKVITLTITDNGHGHSGDPPSSLKRRARLLSAKVTAENAEEGGTRITLKLKSRKFGFKK